MLLGSARCRGTFFSRQKGKGGHISEPLGLLLVQYCHATMKDWTKRKQEKKKAWLEDASSGEDNAEVTNEEVEKWRRDEKNREREEIEAGLIIYTLPLESRPTQAIITNLMC
jgi:hypothetical protein